MTCWNSLMMVARTIRSPKGWNNWVISPIILFVAIVVIKTLCVDEKQFLWDELSIDSGRNIYLEMALHSRYSSPYVWELPSHFLTVWAPTRSNNINTIPTVERALSVGKVSRSSPIANSTSLVLISTCSQRRNFVGLIRKTIRSVSYRSSFNTPSQEIIHSQNIKRKKKMGIKLALSLPLMFTNP